MMFYDRKRRYGELLDALKNCFNQQTNENDYLKVIQSRLQGMKQKQFTVKKARAVIQEQAPSIVLVEEFVKKLEGVKRIDFEKNASDDL